MIGYNNLDNRSDRSSNNVFLLLQKRIEQLDFQDFQKCVFLWLGQRGFANIRNLGRKHPRGRRSVGGADFVARLSGFSDVRLAIQLRHRRTPVLRSCVDELRGYMLRFGVPSGMIVSNSQISRSARRAAAEFPGRPIQLISSNRLAASQAAYVRSHPKSRRTGTHGGPS